MSTPLLRTRMTNRKQICPNSRASTVTDALARPCKWQMPFSGRGVKKSKASSFNVNPDDFRREIFITEKMISLPSNLFGSIVPSTPVYFWHAGCAGVASRALLVYVEIKIIG